MENYSVYEDIANRTGGNIYIGVVGPVRTGKSTFIKRFMETLVLPLANDSVRLEMIDELPQAAAGKTVMTTEPKFVPANAAKICVREGAEINVRLVDCVGFAVEGASGFEEEGSPRLIKTPWQENPMPFEQAAEIGTQKVIREHSTIGVLVTTDGSVTELPRTAYVGAEERTVAELKAMGKPFVILLNCKNPAKVNPLKNAMEEKYGAPVSAMNVETMNEEELKGLLEKALFEFPVARIDVCIPKWLQAFPEENATVSGLMKSLKELAPSLKKMRDCFLVEKVCKENGDFSSLGEIKMDLGKGNVQISLQTKDTLFYQVLSEECGENIQGDLDLMQYVRTLASVKHGYEKVKEAFEQAEEGGYGIVYPQADDYRLQKPQLIKKSAGYGVQFRANAPSYHIVRVDVTGCVSPIIGTKQQGEEFISDALKRYDEDKKEVWETNIFGKSLLNLVEDELDAKTNAMPADVRKKMRRTMSKIVNEGKGNVFCILF